MRISYNFLAEENQNWCEKILKNCQSCFSMVSQKRNLNKNVLNALLNFSSFFLLSRVKRTYSFITVACIRGGEGEPLQLTS